MAAAHFTDRVDEAHRMVDDPANNPEIAGADRELLGTTLRTMRRAIVDRGASEQLLHGEPHPGNLLRTRGGLEFIDLETCCRGPVEFDIAHATTAPSGPPIEVRALYAGADRSLVRECRILMLAMVTAWRCEPGDDLPNRRAKAMDWIRQLRADSGAGVVSRTSGLLRHEQATAREGACRKRPERADHDPFAEPISGRSRWSQELVECV